ncbi:hypothetical protein KUV23_11480 [Algoriphagus marincola]|uniref:Uncharacterized protein n=1 Tax=Algoriphagus marincola TaxID=264027 RepID=A0ABS7N5I9_9BACT|nr:DUF6090 family protein [Algoriphagus marincola]MBY5951600.1 hypothetical protein [Algoriphagus marincola]
MKKGSPVLDYFKEITIVVIGVLIAVSIGNYKERADNEKYIEKTLLAIENDIKSSQPDLDTVFNRHLELFEILREKLEGDEPIGPELTLRELISDFGGFQVAVNKSVSLRFFINHKAELLEYDIISQLLDIESQSELLQSKTRRLTDFVYEEMDKGGEEVLLKFAYYLNDILDSEKSLLDSYLDFLDKNQQKLETEEQ